MDAIGFPSPEKITEEQFINRLKDILPTSAQSDVSRFMDGLSSEATRTMLDEFSLSEEKLLELIDRGVETVFKKPESLEQASDYFFDWLEMLKKSCDAKARAGKGYDVKSVSSKRMEAAVIFSNFLQENFGVNEDTQEVVDEITVLCAAVNLAESDHITRTYNKNTMGITQKAATLHAVAAHVAAFYTAGREDFWSKLSKVAPDRVIEAGEIITLQKGILATVYAIDLFEKFTERERDLHDWSFNVRFPSPREDVEWIDLALGVIDPKVSKEIAPDDPDRERKLLLAFMDHAYIDIKGTVLKHPEVLVAQIVDGVLQVTDSMGDSRPNFEELMEAEIPYSKLLKDPNKFAIILRIPEDCFLPGASVNPEVPIALEAGVSNAIDQIRKKGGLKWP